jgi:hypothetical protein
MRGSIETDKEREGERIRRRGGKREKKKKMKK